MFYNFKLPLTILIWSIQAPLWALPPIEILPMLGAGFIFPILLTLLLGHTLFKVLELSSYVQSWINRLKAWQLILIMVFTFLAVGTGFNLLNNSHHTYSLSVATLHQTLSSTPNQILIIDLRTDTSHRRSHLTRSISHPMKSVQDIVNKLSQLSPDQANRPKIVLACHRGERSSSLVESIRKGRFDELSHLPRQHIYYLHGGHHTMKARYPHHFVSQAPPSNLQALLKPWMTLVGGRKQMLYLFFASHALFFFVFRWHSLKRTLNPMHLQRNPWLYRLSFVHLTIAWLLFEETSLVSDGRYIPWTLNLVFLSFAYFSSIMPSDKRQQIVHTLWHQILGQHTSTPSVDKVFHPILFLGLLLHWGIILQDFVIYTSLWLGFLWICDLSLAFFGSYQLRRHQQPHGLVLSWIGFKTSLSKSPAGPTILKLYVANAPGCFELHNTNQTLLIGLFSGQMQQKCPTPSLNISKFVQTAQEIRATFPSDSIQLQLNDHHAIVAIEILAPDREAPWNLYQQWSTLLPWLQHFKPNDVIWQRYQDGAIQQPLKPLEQDILQERWRHRGGARRALSFLGFRHQLNETLLPPLWLSWGSHHYQLQVQQLLQPQAVLGFKAWQHLRFHAKVRAFIQTACRHLLSTQIAQHHQRITWIQNLLTQSSRRTPRRLIKVLKSLGQEAAFWPELTSQLHLWAWNHQNDNTHHKPWPQQTPHTNQHYHFDLSNSQTPQDLSLAQRHLWICEQMKQNAQDHFLTEWQWVNQLLQTQAPSSLLFCRLKECLSLLQKQTPDSLTKRIQERQKLWQATLHLILPETLTIKTIEKVRCNEASEPKIQSKQSSYLICMPNTRIWGQCQSQAFNPNKITVTPNISPHKVASDTMQGLVLEQGSPLCHQAILVREHNLPSLFHVSQAIQEYPEDSYILINDQGLINKLPQPTSYWTFLNQTTASHGPKAYNLARCAQHNIRIPNAYVIQSLLLEECISLKTWDQPWIHLAQQAPSDLQTNQLPPAIKTILHNLWNTFTCPASGLLVRSSAHNEDSQQHSMAGQYTSIGPIINKEEFERAVTQCWAATWTQGHPDLPKQECHMNLIVQDYIVSSLGGVMFIHDTSDKPIQIDVSSQGPEGTVQGQDVEHLEYDTATHYQASLLLSAQQQDKLLKQAKNLQTIFRTNLDIEWLIHNNNIVILQVRPITTSF